MADVAIDTGLEPRAYLVGKRIGPIWVSGTVGYAFFITSTANSGAGPLKYRKTTDSGATWAAAVTIEAGNCGPFSVWYDKETNGDTGTKIHVAFSDWDNNRMYWISLDTSGDTLATKVQISTTVGGFGFATNYVADGFSTITKARSGDIYVGAGQGDGTSGFWVSANGGTTWTSKTSPGEGDQNDLFQLMPAGDSDSADIACVYLDDTAHELSFKLYDASANTWGNETSIATALNNNVDWPDAYWGFDVAVRHSDNKAIVVYWNYEDNAAADLSACVLTLTAAGANATALTALLSNTVEAGECTVMINGNNDDIYVAYCKGGTWDSLTDVWYKLSTDDGSTWGTATQMNTTQDDIRNVHSMSIVASGQAGRWQPVWPNDDLNDLITNNGLSVSISGGGSGMTGTIAATVTKATAALAGTKSYTGTAAATLQKLTAALSGAMQPSGAVAATLQAATGSAAGTQTQTGTIAATLTKATAAAAGTQTQTGTAAATLSMATASASGVMQPTGAAAATLTKATAALAGTHTGTSPEGTAAATLQAVTAALAGTQTQTGAAAASLQPATAALTGTQQFIGQVAVTLQVATAALAGTHSQTGSLAATLQILTVALLGSQTQTGTLAATLQAATAALAETVAAATPTPIPMTGSYSPSIAMTGSLLAEMTGSYSPGIAMTGSIADG